MQQQNDSALLTTIYEKFKQQGATYMYISIIIYHECEIVLFNDN